MRIRHVFPSSSSHEGGGGGASISSSSSYDLTKASSMGALDQEDEVRFKKTIFVIQKADKLIF